MSFQGTGAGASDAAPCRYRGSRLMFRGPRRRIDRPYLACLGGAETFGRFVAVPFAAHLEQALEVPVINLGCVNAGLDAMLQEPAVLDIAGQARATVVQLFGAQNLSNPFYKVHPRRNDRFVAATGRLTLLFPEVDFTEVHFTRHLLSLLHRTDPARFAEVRTVLRDTWLDRMGRLLAHLGSRTVLLWLRYPAEGVGSAGCRLGPEPLLLDRPLIERLRPRTRRLVEVAVTPAGQGGGLETMTFGPMERPAAEQALGPWVHHDIAVRLMRVLRPHAGT